MWVHPILDIGWCLGGGRYEEVWRVKIIYILLTHPTHPHRQKQCPKQAACVRLWLLESPPPWTGHTAVVGLTWQCSGEVGTIWGAKTCHACLPTARLRVGMIAVLYPGVPSGFLSHKFFQCLFHCLRATLHRVVVSLYPYSLSIFV